MASSDYCSYPEDFDFVEIYTVGSLKNRQKIKDARLIEMLDVTPEKPPIVLPSEEIPESAWKIYAKWGHLLCDSCIKHHNVEYDSEGRIEKIFCESCRIQISLVQENQCKVKSEFCQQHKWVDPVGKISYTCRNCHQYDYDNAQKYIDSLFE